MWIIIHWIKNVDIKEIPVRSDWKSTNEFGCLGFNSDGSQNTLVVLKVLGNMVISKQSDFFPLQISYPCFWLFFFFLGNPLCKYYKLLHLVGYSHNTCCFSGIKITLAWLSKWLSPRLSSCRDSQSTKVETWSLGIISALWQPTCHLPL